MTTVGSPSTAVRKSITVAASVERAFDVFTSGFDSWWPRTHHIGTSPLEKAVIEPGVGGRCYGRSVDGTDCPWGRVVAWDPPHRFAFAWQINGQWQYEPDLAKSSEVEVRFTALADGTTRVDLEHRRLDRHGADEEAVRKGVDSPGGWGGLLQLFADRLEGR